MIDLLIATLLSLGLSLSPSAEVIERMSSKWVEIQTGALTASGKIASYRVLVTHRRFCELQPTDCAHWHTLPHFSRLLPEEIETSVQDFRRRYRQEDFCAMEELQGDQCSLGWMILQSEKNGSRNE